MTKAVRKTASDIITALGGAVCRPIAERKSDGKELVTSIGTEFDKLQALLDKYGNLKDGYVSYDKVDRDQQRELIDQIDATREPLSKLTNAVLGIK